MLSKSQTFVGERVDRFGAFASVACAIHCAVCAFIPSAFAALGIGFLAGHMAEWLLTLIAVASGVAALVLGWLHHRKFRVLVTLSIGIVGLLLARLGESHDHEGGHSDHGGHAAAVSHDDDRPHDHAEDATGHADREHHERHADRENTNHHDDHDQDHEAHEAAHGESAHEAHAHGSGETVGIVAGLILMFGHLSNLRELTRRKRETEGTDCCDEERV